MENIIRKIFHRWCEEQGRKPNLACFEEFIRKYYSHDIPTEGVEMIAELKRELEEREKEKISKLPPFLLRETAEPTVTRAIELLESKEKILRQYFEEEYTEIMEKLRNLLSEIRKYE
ncbi:hypothetical protein DRN69_00150 [Candidatus Pacearchaeota archaeon]|nr:MAG: hypothetical protein DRN69_00150 [Candidatus Pacearchaeota archaeon]